MAQDGGIGGCAPGRTALVILDLINDLDFPGAEEIAPEVLAAADAVAALRARAEAVGVPVVFVNDNFGDWTSDREQLIAHIATRSAHGRELVCRLPPRQDDYFVIKPMHSGFYATNLAVLLPRLGASRLILTGVAAEICVLFTAADAHMREYPLWVPKDCVAPARPGRKEWALEIMRDAMDAETAATEDLSLTDWLGRA